MKKYLILFIIIISLCTAYSVHAGNFISGRAPTKKFTGPNPSNNFNYFLSATARQNFISGNVSGSFTLKDTNYDTLTGSIVDNEADISSSYTPSGSFPLFTSVDTSIATIDQIGKITRVADGTSTINVKITPPTGRQITKKINYRVTRTTGVDTVNFNSYVAGSLARYLYDNIDSRINGVTASDATTKLWSTEDHTTPTYVWNTGFWAYGVDFTSVSPWNSNDGPRRAGVLISPRHIVFAHHFPICTTCTIRFVKQDGTVVTRTIIDQAQVGSDDTQIGLLDSDVPAGISFAKVLPANWFSYLPSTNSTTTVPAIFMLGGAFAVTDTDKQGSLRELWIANTSTIFNTPTVAHRLDFYVRDLQVGDSGNSTFLLINGEAVLVSAFGLNFGDYITEINSVMSSLGGGYSLTTADLSAFNAY